uniref:UNC-45/Cro1/She4 central domain-containing protein n=1 Tax=Bicosoecida sp. CB-2014 TaxID=1486930 RepID=A0A7S1CQY5_9STRA
MEAAIKALVAANEHREIVAQTAAAAHLAALIRNDKSAADALELLAIPALLNCLRKGSGEPRASAALGLARLQSIDPEAPQEVFEARGEPTAVAALLEEVRGGTPKGRGNACMALYELMRGHDPAPAAVAAGGGAAAFVGVIGDVEDGKGAEESKGGDSGGATAEARAEALQALRFLHRSVPSVLDAMLEANAPAAYVALARDGTPRGRADACAALVTIMEASPRASRMAAKAGAASVLDAALRGLDKAARGTVAMAVARLVEGVPDEANKLFDAGTHEPLIAVLTDGVAGGRASHPGDAALALARMQAGSPLVSMTLVELKTHEALLRVLKEDKLPLSKQRAAFALSFFGELEEHVARWAVRDGAVPALLAHLDDKRASTRHECASSVERLLLVAPRETTAAVTAAGGRAKFERAMRDPDAGVVAAVRSVLASLKPEGA